MNTGQIRRVRPPLVIALLWLPIACVATNPAWDGPPVADDGTGTSGDRIATTEDSSAGTTQGDATGAEETTGSLESTDAGTALTSESSAGDETTTTGPVGCAPGERLCDDQCVDPYTDKHACGFACVDCTVLFGNNAKCELGLCRAHGGSGDDGDDGDDG